MEEVQKQEELCCFSSLNVTCKGQDRELKVVILLDAKINRTTQSLLFSSKYFPYNPTHHLLFYTGCFSLFALHRSVICSLFSISFFLSALLFCFVFLWVCFILALSNHFLRDIFFWKSYISINVFLWLRALTYLYSDLFWHYRFNF